MMIDRENLYVLCWACLYGLNMLTFEEGRFVVIFRGNNFAISNFWYRRYFHEIVGGLSFKSFRWII